MKDALFIWVCIHISCFHDVCDRISIMLVSNSLTSCLSVLRAGVIKYLEYRCVPPCSAPGVLSSRCVPPCSAPGVLSSRCVPPCSAKGIPFNQCCGACLQSGTAMAAAGSPCARQGEGELVKHPLLPRAPCHCCLFMHLFEAERLITWGKSCLK